MRTGGQNIKSVSEHKKDGTYRADRHGSRVENVVDKMEYKPKPPDNFDKRHCEKWDEVCARVSDANLLTSHDLDFLEIYVKNWFISKDAWAAVVKHGQIIKGERGPVKNPAISIMNEADKIITNIGNLFAGSPRSRQSLSVTPKEEKKADPFTVFMSGSIPVKSKTA